MGSYTDDQNFYLINPDELVYVEGDLNYNLRRADSRVRPLIEYQYTDVPSVAGSDLPKDIGFKWYKTYTNAIWNYGASTPGATPGVYQDPNAQVDTWFVAGISFESGFGSANQEESRVAYTRNAGMVRLRGRVVRTNGADFTANTTTDFMSLPDSVLPVRARYFHVFGGNASGTDFMNFRIFIPAVSASDKRIEFIKYGGAASGNERYISLNDIYYPLDDTVV